MKFKKPWYIVGMVVVVALLAINAVVASKYANSPDWDDTARLDFLGEVNARVCPTCEDCIKQCRSWGKWNNKIDTALGACKPAPSFSAEWNFAIAYPGNGSLGKVSFWECGLMLFHNNNGYTSPMSLGYDMGDCITVEPRECTQSDEDG